MYQLRMLAVLLSLLALSVCDGRAQQNDNEAAGESAATPRTTAESSAPPTKAESTVSSPATTTTSPAGATADPPKTDTSILGTKRALIVCGLSGDADHHKLFAQNVTQIHAALTTKLGFQSEHVHLLFGDEPSDEDSEPIKSSDRATREELQKHVAAIVEALSPDDALWVIVLGHSHYDGRNSWLNLPGPDIQQMDFAQLFDGITARQQVFVISTPASGFYIKPLSAPHRVVITATEADWETNETEWPSELARILTTPPAAAEMDVDQDGSVSLFDLYVLVARNLAQSYVDRELIATEHATLEDNGDGRGTEVQVDYLTVEQGGRAKPDRPVTETLAPKADGHAAKAIKLTL